MNQKSVYRIAFVPTAGAKQDVYWMKRRLPRVFTWAILKHFYHTFGIKVEYLDDLKEESKARLETAARLFFANKADLIYLAGGYAPKRRISVFTLSQRFLSMKGVVSRLVLGESGDVLTRGNVQLIVDYVGNLAYSNKWIEIIVCSSWYHNGRVIAEIERVLRDKMPGWEVKPTVTIKREDTYPPKTKECIWREYLYNIVAELFARIRAVSPKSIKRFSAAEKKSRENQDLH